MNLREEVVVIPPEPVRIFEKRAARLRDLASGHPAGEFLRAMARLAQIQAAASEALPRRPEGAAPPRLPFELCDPRHAEAWRQALGMIVSGMQPAPLPEAMTNALSLLGRAEPDGVRDCALQILRGRFERVNPAFAPFVSAALQVHWTTLAAGVQPGDARQASARCPVCASPPVAGVVQAGRSLRYLCCSLCATQWYVPRLTCAHCGSTEGISHFTVDGDGRGTKAEACSRCGTYLKLFYLESNPAAEALADDLATLALDLLMSGRAYGRGGVNLFLVASPPRD